MMGIKDLEGRLADATGLSSAPQIEPVPVSPVPASTPSAVDVLLSALQQIVDWKPTEYSFPEDWEKQIAACSECQGWAKNHPIQKGICDTHRRPIWAREAHDKHQDVARGSSMWLIAHDALSEWHTAQAIEARRAATGTGAVHESAVRQDAPTLPFRNPSNTGSSS